MQVMYPSGDAYLHQVKDGQVDNFGCRYAATTNSTLDTFVASGCSGSSERTIFLPSLSFFCNLSALAPISCSCLALCSLAFLAYDNAGSTDDSGMEATEAGAMMGRMWTRGTGGITMGGDSEAEMAEMQQWGKHEGPGPGQAQEPRWEGVVQHLGQREGVRCTCTLCTSHTHILCTCTLHAWTLCTHAICACTYVPAEPTPSMPGLYYPPILYYAPGPWGLLFYPPQSLFYPL